MQHDLLLDYYDRLGPALRARGERIRERVARWLEGRPGLKIHSVTLRLKSRESLAGKLARPDRSYGDLWEITDLVGLRVITYFEDEVDRVGQLLEAHLPVNFEHSIDKRRRRDGTGFGYSSLHYVCRMDVDDAKGAPATRAANDGIPERACFEIQVRTVLEHAWAEIEHDLGYKARDAVPAVVRRRLSRLAGLLEIADQEFVAVRHALDDYARALPSRIESDEEAVPLDALSLVHLLDCVEVRELDVAIAETLGKSLGDEPFFPSYLLKMLDASGIGTVARARAGIRENGAAIVAMVKPYFAFAWATWSLSPDQMERIFRGYSLFFLAHAELLGASTLGIDKVNRLAALYRAIDYPDDERAAHRVASTLVDAFGAVTLPRRG